MYVTRIGSSSEAWKFFCIKTRNCKTRPLQNKTKVKVKTTWLLHCPRTDHGENNNFPENDVVFGPFKTTSFLVHLKQRRFKREMTGKIIPLFFLRNFYYSSFFDIWQVKWYLCFSLKVYYSIFLWHMRGKKQVQYISLDWVHFKIKW